MIDEIMKKVDDIHSECYENTHIERLVADLENMLEELKELNWEKCGDCWYAGGFRIEERPFDGFIGYVLYILGGRGWTLYGHLSWCDIEDAKKEAQRIWDNMLRGDE